MLEYIDLAYFVIICIYEEIIIMKSLILYKHCNTRKLLNAS